MTWRRVLGIAWRSAVALVSAGALVAGGVLWSVQHRLQTDLVTSDAVAPEHAVGAGQPFTALLVGLDARTDAAGNPLPPALLDAMHAGPDEGELHTDTIIVVHVPAEPGPAPVAISIPRDSYVPLADGSGFHKINAAYGRAARATSEKLAAQGVTGPELERRSREAGRAALVDTVENLTGLVIDHYAEINLAGFLELTEALGGVPVCLNAPARDEYSGIDLPAGPQTVSGASALAFVRQRHGLEGGDLDRIGRQQAFVAGLTQRLRETGTLADPTRLAALVGIVTRYVVIDRTWDLTALAQQARTIPFSEMTLHTIPTGRPDLETPADGIAVQVDRTAVRAFSRGLVYGTPVAGTADARPSLAGAPTTPVDGADAPGTTAGNGADAPGGSALAADAQRGPGGAGAGATGAAVPAAAGPGLAVAPTTTRADAPGAAVPTAGGDEIEASATLRAGATGRAGSTEPAAPTTTPRVVSAGSVPCVA